MEIILQLFGAFRPFGEELNLLLPNNATVADIREAFTKKLKELDSDFNKQNLIKSSHFATETEILSEATPLKAGIVIAVIPPVAGG